MKGESWLAKARNAVEIGPASKAGVAEELAPPQFSAMTTRPFIETTGTPIAFTSGW